MVLVRGDRTEPPLKRALYNQSQKPPQKLYPGSWTEAEVDAMEGRRVRFKNGGGEGTVRDAVGLVNQDDVIYQYAVHVTPDGGITILLSKGDAEATGLLTFCPARLCPRKNAWPCQNGEQAAPTPNEITFC